MARWLKILLWIISILIILMSIIWGIFYYYVYINKIPLIKKINIEASKALSGNISIGDLDVVFWKDFPEVNLRLKDISVSDSLVNEHKRNLFQAEEIYIKANLPSFFSSISEIEKVQIVNGSLHLFTDSSGYTNQYMLQGKPKEASETPKRDIYLLFIALENFKLYIDDQPRTKRFDVLFHKFDATLLNTDTNITMNAPTKAHIGGLGFDMQRGAFVEDQELNAILQAEFKKKSNQLIIPEQLLNISGELLSLGMQFDFGVKPNTYEVMIKGDTLHFKKGVSFLNHHIARHFTTVNFEEPLAITTYIKGMMRPKDKPYVKVTFNTTNNKILSDYGTLDSACINGYFDNNFIDGQGYVDANSVIYVNQLKGKYDGNIPFQADTVIIQDLTKTHVTASIHSAFDVKYINDLIGNAIQFNNGHADLNIRFKGYINPKWSQNQELSGNVKVSNASFQYRPKRLSFQDGNIDLQFHKRDVIIENISARTGSSHLRIKGSATNFLNAYYDDPSLMKVTCNVTSPLVNIKDFSTLIQSAPAANNNHRKTVTPPTSSAKKIRQLSSRLNNILEQGTGKFTLSVDKVVMDKFEAQNVKANMDILQDKIALNTIQLQHAGGSIAVDATLYQNQKNNPFELNGKIEKVQMDQFLYAFESFGMKAINHENVTGSFSSSIDIKGNFSDLGSLLTNSIKGNVNFVLENASFQNFTPFTQIKKYVFKRRNLENIQFHEIKNNLIIEHGKVILFPMEIRNNAMNIFVKGIYGFEKGTDLSIEIPLSNPKKDNERALQGVVNKRKGLKVFLRAIDDDNGGINIIWDWQQKGADAVDAKLHLNEDGELMDDGTSIIQELIQQEQKATESIEVAPKTRSPFIRKLKSIFNNQESGKIK